MRSSHQGLGRARLAPAAAACWLVAFVGLPCCGTNDWDDSLGTGGGGGSGGEADLPPGGGPGDAPGGIEDVSEATMCDGRDNDGDGLVDEDCGCAAGATQPCYDGASFDVIEGTPCEHGVQTCLAEGGEFASWGPCVGSVLPGPEICWDGIDNDCDGEVDDGCACVPGEGRRCYEGPEETLGVGVCRAGEETCIGEGMGWTLCEGQVLPEEEICGDGLDNDCDGEVDEGCIIPIVPARCTEATMTHVVGAGDCGPDQAVFMMDDGDGPNFICCPLPAADILTDDPAVVRGTTCAADEVITGAAGSYSYRCSRVNTLRYQLAAPARPCYFGSGAAGGSGVPGCADHPHTFSVLHEWYFGSDGCSGLPYGSLFVSMTGDDCRDLAAAELRFTGAVAGDPAGAAVPMFAE